MTLPIVALLPELRKLWREPKILIIEAPTGAGKTTYLPLALMNESWLAGKKIFLLEPRRLPALAAAERMAAQLVENTGEHVGYQVRLQKKLGPKTLIEVMTYGIFLRRIQADPSLENVGLVLFDEFHERTIEADLAFAFAHDAKIQIRPDLRLGLLSATFDGVNLAEKIPGALTLRSEGRLFPVEVAHSDPCGERLEVHIAKIVHRALAKQESDVLVFLPGATEIRRCFSELEGIGQQYAVLKLHGDLPLTEQDIVLKPDPKGRRKIILATNIAETSLTIEGVAVVIDSGLKRQAVFDPGSGMTRLETRRIALSEADQRKGRAGRTRPGVCYRLWPIQEERALVRFAEPEVRRADLTSFVLEIASWGGGEALLLLEQPNKAHCDQARDLLVELEALDSQGRMTSLGQEMIALGTHPRLAHMMIKGKQMGLGALAADIAAILNERDPLKADDADLRHRLDYLWGDLGGGERRDHFRRQAQAFAHQLAVTQRNGKRDREKTGLLVALAYPDRIAQKTEAQFRLSNGKGATLPTADKLMHQPFLAVAALDGKAKQARIFLAAPIQVADIEESYPGQISDESLIGWDKSSEAVVAVRQKRFHALVLAQRIWQNPPQDQVATAMIDGIRQIGLHCLPWTEETRQLQARLAFIRTQEPTWPRFCDDALMDDLEGWLAPFLSGITRPDHLRKLDMKEVLLSRIDWRQRQELEDWAPESLVVPSGARHRIDYSGPEPILSVKLQEMFGTEETPRIAKGRVPLLLHLLSPARRPVQVTRDLKGFWENAYFDVRKDLRGQYPKHPWPDDPISATPTARTKRRQT